MPVDPGNLLLLATLHGKPALGLPGCCRSPKLNGLDWVLQRLAAGIEVTPGDVARMAVGGLLTEIPSRPQPRGEPAEPLAAPRKRRVAAVVLAAGQSRRMGKENKLLLRVDGKPMLRHVVEAAVGAGLREVVVVTGHEPAAVEAALSGLPVRYVHNPDYAEGLSTSLKSGIAGLGRKIDGALVCLGDMPRVTAAQLRRLVEAFDPAAGRGIVVPTHGGKRGNPVLWGREHFAAMQELSGDVGARHLIGQHEAKLALVELENEAPLLDIDTPEAFQALTGAAA
jgi:molybdenum cofactor cytidylyltransferase